MKVSKTLDIKYILTLFLLGAISGGAMIVFGMFGILAEILNPPIFEKLLAKLKIPLTYDNYLLVSYISLAIFIVTKKIFWRLIIMYFRTSIF